MRVGMLSKVEPPLVAGNRTPFAGFLRSAGVLDDDVASRPAGRVPPEAGT